MEKHRGTIKKYFKKRGYGFVTDLDQEGEYFFVISEQNETLKEKTLFSGLEVEFQIVSYLKNGKRRLKAFDMKPVPVSEDDIFKFDWDHVN